MKYLVARGHSIYDEHPSIEVVENINDFTPDLLAYPDIETIEAESKEEASEIYIKKHNLKDIKLAEWC